MVKHSTAIEIDFLIADFSAGQAIEVFKSQIIA